MDYNRIIKIGVIVLIIAGVGIGGYFLWQWLGTRISENLPQGNIPGTEVVNTGEGETTGTNATEIETTTQEPQAVAQKLSILINSPVFEYWLNPKESSVYFTNLDGQIIKINSDNTRKLVNSQTLPNLNNILTSADGTAAIAEFNYPHLPTLSLFLASSTSWQPFSPDTISAAFSPDSQKIAYINGAGLQILDLQTKKITEVQKMSQVGFKLAWIRDNQLLFYESPSADTSTSMYLFDLSSKTIKLIVDGENGVDIKWSKNGNLGIKLSSFQRIPKLSLVDELANTIVNMTFKTVPEKCVFDSQKIYCGIPQNIRQGIVLPDNFYKKADYFIDDIYMLDLPTGKITKLFDGNEVALDAVDLKIKDNALLFINRYDQKVYSLRLD